MKPYFDDSGLVAIRPSAWRAMCEAATAHEAVAARTRVDRAETGTPGVAVVPVFGPISKGTTWYTDLVGGAPLDRVQSQLWAAGADDGIAGIVMHIDSPGGGVYGVDEAAATVSAVAKRKPLIAYTDGQMASAAFWLGSHATAIVAAPSAEVGSIGVYGVHLDESKFLEAEGITATLIKAGDHKAEGHPFFPLSEDDRAAIQSRIDDYYRMFTATVARGRGVPVDTARGAAFGGGRVLGASQAVAAGMADQVGGFMDVVRRLRHDASGRAAARAAWQDEHSRTAAALAMAGA